MKLGSAILAGDNCLVDLIYSELSHCIYLQLLMLQWNEFLVGDFATLLPIIASDLIGFACTINCDTWYGRDPAHLFHTTEVGISHLPSYNLLKIWLGGVLPWSKYVLICKSLWYIYPMFCWPLQLKFPKDSKGLFQLS